MTIIQGLVRKMRKMASFRRHGSTVRYVKLVGGIEEAVRRGMLSPKYLKKDQLA